jgi:hypothetical protein
MVEVTIQAWLIRPHNNQVTMEASLAGDETNRLHDWHDWDVAMEVNLVCDALIGKTDADNVSHAIVRDAFLREFWIDEKVQTLVSHWAKITGLEERALRLADAGDRLAKLAGLHSRGALADTKELTVADDKEQEGNALVLEWNSAFDDLMSRFDTVKDNAEIGKEAIEFIINLGLPYPWLAIELIESTFFAILGFALGQVYRIERWYEPEPLHEIEAPMTTMSFQTHEGECVEQALKRLLHEAKETAKKLLEPVPRPGRFPDRRIAVLERNGRWFYRHKVKGDSIRAIAVSELGSSDRRKDIYDGIKRAEELLRLTLYTF